MAVHFEPELGQALFSNAGFGSYALPSYVEWGLRALGSLVAAGRVGFEDEGALWVENPCNNVGPGANFENDVFAMRAYCWCDGEREGHGEGCPPNFECGEVRVWWYKRAGRGSSISQIVSPAEWREIFERCASSLLQQRGNDNA